MTTSCETVRELLPAHRAGRLDVPDASVVEEHLGICAECAAEAHLVGLLLESRPAVPPGLADAVKRAARRPPRETPRPWWGLVAAAVAAVAIGIGVMSPDAGRELEVPAYVAAHEDEGLSLDQDGLIAGAPALDALSDEELAALLEEITEGGAA